MINVRKHHLILIAVGLVIVVGLSISPLISASCSTRHNAQGEAAALAQLRSMTRGGVLPAESILTKIEADFPNSKPAGLARILRARIKLNAGDVAGAAALLDSPVITRQTALGDYALLMKARALEQANRKSEARATYEKLVRDYPSSINAREATLRNADLVMQEGQPASVPLLLKDLGERNDAGALLLIAKSYGQSGDRTSSLKYYRQLYFFAPASIESTEALDAIVRLNSSTQSPATAEEAISRAEGLYAAKRYKEADEAYGEAFIRFPQTATAQAQLHRGIALSNLKRTPDAVAALSSIPTSAGETRAEAFYHIAQTYAQARQWDMARKTLDDMRRTFAASPWTVRALVRAGELARDAKNATDSSFFFRTALNSYPNAIEVAQAQFELAWFAHESKNFQESARLLTEHLALYADRNTDNRGRAGYWAARDSERAGKSAEASALYEAMQGRYSANWYGYLAKQRLEILKRNRNVQQQTFAPDSMTGRAIANLQTVTVADETAGPEQQERISKADQLTNIGFDDWGSGELELAMRSAPDSPRITLALARIYRSHDDNVRALNTLKKSFPDYAQMRPEELTREQWDIFYPLAYWDIIVQESRSRQLDPFQVAGLIRQESVFIARASSSARAFGLMQLLVPTAKLTAKKYGVEREVTSESLFEPRLNIQLGTAYLRDQMDKYGRIEYVAAAYNAGPGRVVQWRASLPLELDEWTEAIPFKETRGYVQGVVRNGLQYKRLYDDNGNFRPEVGSHALRSSIDAAQPSASATQSNKNADVRPRRVGNEEE